MFFYKYFKSISLKGFFLSFGMTEEQCFNHLQDENPESDNETIIDLQELANTIQCEVEGRAILNRNLQTDRYNSDARIARGNIQIGELDSIDENTLSFFVKSWQQTSQVNIDRIERKIEVSGIDISRYPSINIEQINLDDDVFQSTIIELANFINKLKLEGIIVVGDNGEMQWNGGNYSTTRFGPFEEFLSSVLDS